MLAPPVTVHGREVCPGEVLASWGAGELFMPHMVTVDRDGHVWVVDVAMHQVIKFSGTGQKLLELGRRLEPGHDDSYLCKPTHVYTPTHTLVYLCHWSPSQLGRSAAGCMLGSGLKG